MALAITTNNHVRPFVGDPEASIVIFRGEPLDVSEAQVAPDDFKALGWDGVIATSYFDGIAVRYFDRDGKAFDDGVVIGHFYYSED